MRDLHDYLSANDLKFLSFQYCSNYPSNQ